MAAGATDLIGARELDILHMCMLKGTEITTEALAFCDMPYLTTTCSTLLHSSTVHPTLVWSGLLGEAAGLPVANNTVKQCSVSHCGTCRNDLHCRS